MSKLVMGISNLILIMLLLLTAINGSSQSGYLEQYDILVDISDGSYKSWSNKEKKRLKKYAPYVRYLKAMDKTALKNELDSLGKLYHKLQDFVSVEDSIVVDVPKENSDSLRLISMDRQIMKLQKDNNRLLSEGNLLRADQTTKTTERAAELHQATGVGVKVALVNDQLDFRLCDEETIKSFLRTSPYNESEVRSLYQGCNSENYAKSTLKGYCEKTIRAFDYMSDLIDAYDPEVASYLYDNKIGQLVENEFSQYGYLRTQFTAKRNELNRENIQVNPITRPMNCPNL